MSGNPMLEDLSKSQEMLQTISQEELKSFSN